MGVAILLTPLAAGAANDPKACVAAADSGQQLRDANKLQSARAQFLVCARDTCPKVVSHQCITWLRDLERDIPTVTFRATDGGKEILDVQVFVDGEQRVDSLDGRAVPLDPGVRKIRYVHPGSPEIEETVVIRAGERGRLLDVKWNPEGEQKAAATPAHTSDSTASEAASGGPGGPGGPTEPPPQRAFRIPLVSIVAGGVFVGSTIAAVFFVNAAADDQKSLKAACAPACAQSDVDAARANLVYGNIALGIGIAGAVVAGVTLVTANVGRSPKKSARLDLRAQPTAQGGWAGLAGSF